MNAVLNHVWLLVAVLFLCQYGFMSLESRLSAAGTSANGTIRRQMQFLTHTALFWSIGFSLANFGGYYFARADLSASEAAGWLWGTVLFAIHGLFCSSVVWPLSSRSQRLRFPAYLLVTACCSATMFLYAGVFATGSEPVPLQLCVRAFAAAVSFASSMALASMISVMNEFAGASKTRRVRVDPSHPLLSRTGRRPLARAESVRRFMSASSDLVSDLRESIFTIHRPDDADRKSEPVRRPIYSTARRSNPARATEKARSKDSSRISRHSDRTTTRLDSKPKARVSP